MRTARCAPPCSIHKHGDVLIFVHSFIRRLEQSLGHVDGCFHNLIVYSALCTISFYGTDGGRLDFLEVDRVLTKKIRRFGLDVVFGAVRWKWHFIEWCASRCLCRQTNRLIEWVESLNSQFRFTSTVIIFTYFFRAKLRHASAVVYQS